MESTGNPTTQIDPAAFGVYRRRRSRIVRNVVILVLMGSSFLAVVVVIRNNSRLNDARDKFESAIASLKQTFERTGVLPVTYPGRSPLAPTAPETNLIYMDEVMARQVNQLDDPIIVAHTPKIRMALGPDKRIIALREGQTIRVEAIGETDFNDRYDHQKQQAEKAAQSASSQS